MPDLEEILRSGFVEFKQFSARLLDLDPDRSKALNANRPNFLISNRLGDYAALSFSNTNQYRFEFQPEAVEDHLARSEEFGHYVSFAINPQAKIDLFKSDVGSDNYIKLIYREEYIARLLALMYLDSKGMQLNRNQVWSRFEDKRVVLVTDRPKDVLSHYLGYTKAEADFKNLSPQQLKDKLRRIWYTNGLSEFNDLNRFDMPQILTPQQFYQLAA